MGNYILGLKIMNNFKNFFLFFYLLFVPSILAEGFVAGTLVKTEAGFVPIEQIKEGDSVCAYGFDRHYYPEQVISVDQNEVPCFIKLIIEGEVILTTPEQYFLKEPEEIWEPAANLQPGDKVHACSGYLTIEAIELFPEPVVVFAVSVANRGNFYVARHEILVHNMGPCVGPMVKVLAQTPQGLWVLKKVVEYGTYFGTVALGGYLATKCKDKIRQWSEPEKKPSRGPVAAGGGNGKPPDDPNDPYQQYSGYRAPKNLGDWDPKKTKITRTYDNAPYHHKVGNGIKSAAPLNGQAALDNSYTFSDTSRNRIGISCNQFVVLDWTQGFVYHDARQTETFHGHVREWKELTEDMRRALTRNGVATKGGKIIK